MRYSVPHSIAGRIRFKFDEPFSEHDAAALEDALLCIPHVKKVMLYPRIGSVAVEYEEGHGTLDRIEQKVQDLTPEELAHWEFNDPLVLAPKPERLILQLANASFWFLVKMIFVPKPLKLLVWVWSALPFWRAGIKQLEKGRLNVDVLDATAIALGFTQGASNAGEIMFLLQIGELLEAYTQKRAQTTLARSLLALPSKARILNGDVEEEVDLASLEQGDLVVVRTGFDIPADGTVVCGEAMVNQSTLTGESMPVLRKEGDTAFAGTALVEGELVIKIDGDPRQSKIQAIATAVESSNSEKSTDQKQIENMADVLVPWNFALAGIVALATRSLQKTAAVMMVDYSCALRMSSAISVMAAQREGADLGFMVRGSKYFQDVRESDVIVFDKTGTLTSAELKVCHVEPFNGYTRDEALRLAACLEEHFPHPVARAVVRKAAEEGLEHRETHTAVEYIVAHGIASSLDGERVVIGSQHFVLEDEGVSVPQEQLDYIRSLNPSASALYLAVNNQLRGVIYVEDVVRPNAKEVISKLRDDGFKRIIMLTGDEKDAADRIAEKVGIVEYRSGMLPEEKCDFIRELQAEGHKVCMVGDGVNDSPALAAADLSIAMSAGSAVARETADITLTSNDLESIVALRHLARKLNKRMQNGFKFTIGFNSLLLALGIAGVITPQASSFLHNGSTIALSVANSRHYL